MSVSNLRTRAVHSLISMTALCLAVGGCAAGGDDADAEVSVSPKVQVIDRTSQALSTGALQWVNGTYGGCRNRTGAWSARISGVVAMTNSAVTVVKDDTDCALTVTGLFADVSYTGTPSILLGTDYFATGSSFANLANPVAFYANAKADQLDFDVNFAITILFSDNVNSTTPAVTATYASVSSSANAETQVPAPNYTLSFTGLDVQTDVDNVVETATGDVAFVPGTRLGEFYVVNTNQTLGATFAIIDAAYAAGTAVAYPTDPANLIPADSFTLVGVTLPVIRNIIVIHEVSGVESYEVIRVTFNAPVIVP